MEENDMETCDLFVRGNSTANSDSGQDDDWDDSALIKAYDKAVNLAKEEVSRRMGEEAHSSNTKKTKSTTNKKKCPILQNKKWIVGDLCRARYSEDGKIYEAVIIEIMDDSDKCTVKYIGYGNTETVKLSSLIESAGVESQTAQIRTMKAENQSKQCNGTNTANQMDFEEIKYSNSFPFNLMTGDMPPAPPLPPQLIARLPENNEDALSSMLMSWYISGFHTGYYHGLKHAQEDHEKRKK